MKHITLYLRIIIALGLLGLADSLYLTYQHYSDVIPPCSVNPLIDCGKVLGSQYATIYGVPLALLGAMHYAVLTGLMGASLYLQNVRIFQLGLAQSFIGAVISAYLVYLQIGVLSAICLFCMGSAIISFTLFVCAVSAYRTYEHSKTRPQSIS